MSVLLCRYLSLILLICQCWPVISSTDVLHGQLVFAPTPRFRLPTTVYPLNYNLRLLVVLDPLPNYERFTVTADVSINTTCKEATNKIYLHAVNLTIFNESVRVVSKSSGLDLTVSNLTYETENDFFIITLASDLEQGDDYWIYMRFIAPIPDDRLNGMYQDYYLDPETAETRYLATTLFAPYHARRLFPSFDEPSFRAKYEVEIGHHTKYHAMANEEIVNTRPVEGLTDYVWDVFAATPSISSYITAMIVSDFTYEEAVPNNFLNRTVRVYATPHLITMGAGEYAANITDAVMAFLENRFLVKYPLSKLYSIALPNFFFNAMENIGMITYKEPVLLYLKNETTEEERYKINYVMSHELSHQWFGNIVACKWWAYVWLKEGFATFYSHYGMNHTNPELNPWEMFIPNILHVAMNFDASNVTHPLENFPPTSAAVADIYTRIPYEKGASVLRMTSSFITENIFERAIKEYVDKFQYQSAEQTDLFDALQVELDNDPLISQYIPASVREIMSSWCQQSRFPVVSVSVNGTSQIQLAQEEFSDEGPTNSSKTWWVPINIQPRTRPDLPDTIPDAWIPQYVSSISIDINAGETVIVNPDATGYYRVKYDEYLTLKITELLEKNHTSIPPTGRSKLLDDYFQLALSGYLPFESAIELTKYIHLDRSIGVWKILKISMDHILNLLTLIDDNETTELLQDYLLSKVKLAWNALEFYDEIERVGADGMLYELLSGWSCYLGSCLALSDDEITTFIQNPTEKFAMVPKEKQFVLYCLVASQDARNSTFQYILNEYVNPQTLFGRKQRLLKALSCSNDPETLTWLIDTIFSFNNDAYFAMPEPDRKDLLQALAENPTSAELVLDKIIKNAEVFFERFEPDTCSNVLSRIAENIRLNSSENKVMTLLTKLRNNGTFIDVNAKRFESQIRRSRASQALLSKSHLQLRQWLKANI